MNEAFGNHVEENGEVIASFKTQEDAELFREAKLFGWKCLGFFDDFATWPVKYRHFNERYEPSEVKPDAVAG